jgi:hypothetical protein
MGGRHKFLGFITATDFNFKLETDSDGVGIFFLYDHVYACVIKTRIPAGYFGKL